MVRDGDSSAQLDWTFSDGTDTGTPNANANDTFLPRRDFVALLNAVPSSTVERVNYDQNINEMLTVNGLAGNDKIVADDNSTETTIDGGAGKDTFQIGQVFGTPRDANAGVAPGDEIDTTAVIIGVIRDPVTNAVIFDPTTFDLVHDQIPQTTIDAINAAIAYQAGHKDANGDPDPLPLDGIAYLSNGVSFHTTILGGTENDVFSIYRNVGTLTLQGEGGDDQFIVRGFVTVDLTGFFGRRLTWFLRW